MADRARGARANPNRTAPMLMPACRSRLVCCSRPTAHHAGNARANPNRTAPMLMPAGRSSHVLLRGRWPATPAGRERTRTGGRQCSWRPAHEPASALRGPRRTTPAARERTGTGGYRCSCWPADQATSGFEADDGPRRQRESESEREGADFHAGRQIKPRPSSRPMAIHAGGARANPNGRGPMLMPAGGSSHIPLGGRWGTTPAASERPARKPWGRYRARKWAPCPTSVAQRSECPAPARPPSKAASP